MLARALSAGLVGIDARQVEIEIDIVRGLPGFAIVGLPDAAIRESKDRIRSAIENSCFEFPPKNFVANLAPAFFKKEGSNFDLSIAAAILQATGQIDSDPSSIPMIGELSLDGSVKPVRGILSMVLALLRAGHSRVIVPYENRIEACAISQIEIFPVKSLREMVGVLSGKISPCKESDAPNEDETFSADFAHVYGQESVKRAIEIAASGHHNILLYGPPGSGKSLIARCMPSILPRLTREESLETSMIHSVSGTLDTKRGLILSPPFRAPHHTASDIAIVGGGKIPSAGEISLAHNGVLFMDEFSEFRTNVLQTLRQPLEDCSVTISRATGRISYPSDFVLIASMNPCPCGFFFEREVKCRCTPLDVMRYRKKLSGPVLDRIDIEIYVPRIQYRELMDLENSESSSAIRSRVEKVRLIQRERFRGRTRYNARMDSDEVRRFCRLDDESAKFMECASGKMKLSARSVFRVLKVARTIADHAQSERVLLSHCAEALSYKNITAQYDSRLG